MGFSKSLATAALLSAAQALYLNGDLSLGQDNKVSTDLRSVSNFQLSGTPNVPQVLSNKVILTPPVPGNQRGAVWSDKTLEHSSWMIDLDFRATGPERASGNLNLWYVKDGRDKVGSASVYTVGKFDGLALVVDQYAGSGGFIRGFLNDGNTDYNSHHSVDSLSFGHCEYSYRNLGRASRIAVRQSQDNFRVDVDGHLCFETSRVRLPTGNQLGVSAASAENADSFEVFKLVVTTDSMTPDSGSPNSNPYPRGDAAPVNNPPNSDQPASSIPVSAQFSDLHNRLQAMMKNINAMNRDISSSQSQTQSRFTSLDEKLSRLEQSLNKLDSFDKKLTQIQEDVRRTSNDLNALDRQARGLRSVVSANHDSMLGSLPGIMGYVVVVIASQVVTVVGYLLYKKRKHGGPKKYI